MSSRRRATNASRRRTTNACDASVSRGSSVAAESDQTGCLYINEASIQRLERHVQKLAHAAQVSFAERALFRAECTLLDNRNQMLTRINNKAKVRRSTRSIVLSKAKVMSFEDIEVAQTARAAKDVIKDKGKPSRKGTSAALEADERESRRRRSQKWHMLRKRT